ncbi:alkaline phosphatase family protein [Candidatus Zixiibacteriota bacterium]
MQRQIIILGFDGATWDIIDPMISRGELPNFRRLKETGASGEVNTTYTGSPVIWTAIFTGKDRQKFGDPFFGINHSRLQAKRIWEIASQRGLRVGVLHSLLTWPPLEVDGFVIPDIFAIGPETHPPEYQNFQKLYLSRHGKNLAKQGYYVMRGFLLSGSLRVALAMFKLLFSSLLHPEALNTFRRRLMVVTKLDHNLFLKLHRKYRPRLTTFHLHALDTVSHKYWQFMNKPGRYNKVIAEFYREADHFLGKVFSLLDEKTTLVVVADHGFKEHIDGRGKFELRVPVLRKLLNIDSAARIVRIGNAFVMNLGGSGARERADELAETIRSATLQNGAPLFVNVNEIDRNVHFRLNKLILESKDPMGEPVVFAGKGWQMTFAHLFRKKAFIDTGIHDAGRGIFAICGPDIRPNANLQRVDIFDITPTLLTLLGLPVAKDMDGDFDKRWFAAEALKSINPEYIPTYEADKEKGEQIGTEVYSESEVEDLEERLKMLGYL